MIKLVSHSPYETKTLGKMLSRSLLPGSIVVAYGDLGAGKTVIAKGIADGLGVKQIVNSPTFNIMKVYKGKALTFYHIDAYRLESPTAVSDIGLDEALGDKDGIAFVEWPEYIPQWLEGYKNIITIHIHMEKDGTRTIGIEEGLKHE